jgi:hypothetical protein
MEVRSLNVNLSETTTENSLDLAGFTLHALCIYTPISMFVRSRSFLQIVSQKPAQVKGKIDSVPNRRDMNTCGLSGDKNP